MQSTWKEPNDHLYYFLENVGYLFSTLGSKLSFVNIDLTIYLLDTN